MITYLLSPHTWRLEGWYLAWMFFSKESFTYLYREYLIKSRNHILYNCRQYRKYWNSRRDFLKDIIAFLEFNPRVFFFHEDIT